MSMIRQKNMSKQSMMGDGNKPGTRPGTRRNSVTASGFGSNAGSLLWAARNSIAFQTGKGGFKMPKYQNTYQLESPNPMEISVIDKILTNVMNEQLKDVKNYDPVRSKKLCQDMGIEIRKQIYKKNYSRYKFIVTVTIIEKQHQATNFGLGFLWDHERDNYSRYVFENPNYYAIGIVAGVYFE